MKLNVEDYCQSVRSILPRFLFDYVDGSAERAACLQRNWQALDDLVLVSHAMRDTSELALRIEVLGQIWRYPVAIAPMALAPWRLRWVPKMYLWGARYFTA
jgi:(S)-mandelate dehydrogenase